MTNKMLSHIVRPWDKEIEGILQRLTHDKVAYSHNTRIGSDFGRNCPELIDNGLIDVVTTHYRKQPPKTIFILNPGVVIVPKNKKFSFHKIF